MVYHILVPLCGVGYKRFRGEAICFGAARAFTVEEFNVVGVSLLESYDCFNI